MSTAAIANRSVALDFNALKHVADRVEDKAENVLHDAGHVAHNVVDSFEDFGGAAIGWAEKLGLVYPVKHYKAQVSDGLWRGSRLTDQEFANLAKSGVKTTVDLRAESSDEPGRAAKYGMRTLRIPITDNTSPTMGQVKTFLDYVSKPENQPAYVHCQAGVGRTGVMVAAYRMAVQGWSADKAIAEAKSDGMAMPNQEKFLRQFSAQLDAGKIAGYPLVPRK